MSGKSLGSEAAMRNRKKRRSHPRARLLLCGPRDAVQHLVSLLCPLTCSVAVWLSTLARAFISKRYFEE